MEVSRGQVVSRREIAGAVPTWALVGGSIAGSYVLGIPLVIPIASLVAYYGFGLSWLFAIGAGIGAALLLEAITQLTGK